MERGSRIKEEIKGVLAILAGLVIVISLISHNPWDQSFSTESPELRNLLGAFGSNLSDILLQTVGLASYLIPAILIISGLRKVSGRSTPRNKAVFIASFIILILSTSSLLTIIFSPHSGGTAGIFSTGITLKTVSTTGSYLLFTTLTLVSLMYLIQFSLANLFVTIKNRISYASKAVSSVKLKNKVEKQPHILEEAEPYEQESLPLTFNDTKSGPAKKTVSRPAKKISSEYELPGINLLNDPPPSKSRPPKGELLERSGLLEKKLLDYSVEGKVTYVSPGPIVTMFEFEPAPGIKISKVMSLSDDLAMALKATSIRISPIHGRSTLGIEVPNKEREDVFLKDIIANEFHKSHSKLTLALGKDIFGVPVMADLSKMPHLLIAGATGSGKSVGMNSIVLSLLFRATPKEVKMLMIDPKMLELSAYEEIPHLLMPVITLPKEASNALKRLVFEMERRYRLLAESGARNIEAYNRKRSRPASDTNGDDKEHLPYIVIFIDELADLMFASGREVEDSIARLAGMARAAGIHLVLATQRPSVDVITGIIKANFPSRISFQVSSKMDSRIILDTYGADQLLGKGDMLFTSPGKKIKRIHGAYVSEEEIRDVVNFIKAQAGPDYTLFEDLTAEPIEESNQENKDELYSQAKEIVLSAGQASISYIQRRMKIGYNRAARIMEALEEEGIVGPPGEAGKPREIIRRS
ncbi:MAG TPA: DNA translocase FtsK [Nitrospirae bacterium]|nr:DNA translocase SpoIIIE [bacterium BMS3Abin06]GBD98018.1 DNA translocase SpoIIIE [bacterium BMS3Abin07]HDH13426.1 DNA translocase FtsK [Nitrospirota bacterium]HDZ02159.1 DNA translocase FtsK [Nitrospirota bacterium]